LDLVSAVQNRGLGCGLVQNKMLVGTVSVSLVTQLALVYVPFMQVIFQTAALKLSDLSVILGLAGTSFGLHEVRRGYERRLDAEDNFASVMEELA
jgi:Ca2+-transporting ATPase